MLKKINSLILIKQYTKYKTQKRDIDAYELSYAQLEHKKANLPLIGVQDGLRLLGKPVLDLEVNITIKACNINGHCEIHCADRVWY